jgi:mono/diheme cytochrome c family protein
MGRILLGFLLAIVLVPIALLGWLRFGKVPVAVADPPFPYEREIVAIPLNARINREMVKTPVIQATEDNLVAGARVYGANCAVCHGLHGKPSVFGGHIYPDAPPLWEKSPNSAAVGVSDDPPGATYWKVDNGIRLTGMPSFKRVLTGTEMWQVSLLLANADKPLPPAAVEILRGRTPAPSSAATEAASPNQETK